MLRHIAQTAVITAALPYVSRELPGWGHVYGALVGGWRRDWLWKGAPPRRVRDKIFGHEILVDLTKWSDRSTFFLRRWYDLETQMLLSAALRTGDVVVDIGANRGMFTLAASKLVGSTGQVIAFEPNPTVAAVLDGDLQHNRITNVTLHQIGLGDKNGTFPLFVPLINSGEGSFARLPYDQQTTVQVPVRVGDDILAGVTPNLIKIDVEGFEYCVIDGLRDTIARSYPVILTEVVDEHLKRCGSSRHDLFSLMQGLGYRGFGLGLTRHGIAPEISLIEDLTQDTFNDIAWLPPGRSANELLGQGKA